VDTAIELRLSIKENVILITSDLVSVPAIFLNNQFSAEHGHLKGKAYCSVLFDYFQQVFQNRDDCGWNAFGFQARDRIKKMSFEV
jgi:hypothetical protein